MRVILHGMAHDVGHFIIASVVQTIHGVQDAALHRLQSIVEMRDGTLKDDVRGIVKKPVLVHAAQLVLLVRLLACSRNMICRVGACSVVQILHFGGRFLPNFVCSLCFFVVFHAYLKIILAKIQTFPEKITYFALQNFKKEEKWHNKKMFSRKSYHIAKSTDLFFHPAKSMTVWVQSMTTARWASS